ncbi:MAG: helix-hairpin-helix domain-containing protein [Nanoarchaeota archaeon]|nr:helix-hairpin-helix domain-containing protein [Nanoarchaeota archaeon]MBU4116209.1 helix-hairpin-helix domain-containing protein [Nanoarchaeota archaeon]
MKYALIILFILTFQNIYALCEENQIDINTASTEDLDTLYGIGSVKAEAIINSRPFEIVDDLINVIGIGEITLQKIKEQGLACVESEDFDEEFKEEIEIEIIKEDEEEIIEKDSEETENFIGAEIETQAPELIRLNPQVIKTQSDKENSDNKTLKSIILNKNKASYGFIVFCVLLGFLYIIKLKKTCKNEFE